MTAEEKDQIKRYVALRYSHWSRDERRKRCRMMGRALDTSTPERHARFLDEVEAFFKRHAPLLAAGPANLVS
jgi:hypothetical protein